MKMQIQTPPMLAAEIAKLSARLIAAGVRKQAARPGKIYRKLVEYGVERWHTELFDARPADHGLINQLSGKNGLYFSLSSNMPAAHELINQLSGGRGNQIDFAPATRQEIWTIAGQLGMKQVEAANACAWWGLEAFTQYVHALEASYTPKEKRSVGRPRKYASHE